MKWLLFLLLMTPASAIVNGVNIPNNSGLAKAVVLIFSDSGQGCSGTLVSENIVLTAAHCIFKNQNQSIAFRDDEGKYTVVRVQKTVIHPDFKPFNRADKLLPIDLALVQLQTPAPDFVKPVAMIGGAKVGDNLTLAGRGKKQDNAIKPDGTLSAVRLNISQKISERHFMLIGQNQGACGGDSGGPALLDGGIAGVIIIAAGKEKNGCGIYTAILSLTFYLPWINKTMNELRTVKIK
jgi:hypothetical protein